MRDILTIAKRELRAIFTNKTMIVSVILVPFLIMFASMTVGTMFEAEPVVDETYKINGYVVNTPELFGSTFADVGLIEATTNDIEEIQDKISDGIVDLLVVFPAEFHLTYDETQLCNVEMWYNSNNLDSTYAQQFVVGILDSTRPVTFTLNIDNPESYDLGPELDMFKEMLNIFFPLYSIYCICLASMTIAASSIAGEKENGFMNLLLISPVKRKHIALGKCLALFGTNLCTATVVILATILSTCMYTFADIELVVSYSATDYLILFITSLTGAFVVTSICLLISAYAKTAKEATSRCSIALIFVMLIGLFVNFPMGIDFINKIANYYHLIPVANSMLIAADVINGEANIINAFIASGINLVTALACTIFASTLFEKEKVMQL